ncbi:nitrogenase molybdenum-iron protein alpha chain [Deferrisoma camini]|uniref:nitrogenase molybdenum-iron protein alpha chain n=1 Tax=Deferrisoma camini TaxID=1035120 RepID=UPI00046CFB59|nr:nitrogenase molybdenum-iron protein alpha chain [Deferrisoma camini]
MASEAPRPEDTKRVITEAYPSKAARKRAKQIVVNAPPDTEGFRPQILSNTRTTPGVITQRGCSYAGCKGVILGPVRDILTITHGPVGCGFYSWLTRRNQTRPPSEDAPNYMPYALMTDMQENDIVFGGEKKLRKAIREAYEIFRPKAIAIAATCPVGLIGDDIHAVARDMKEELGINVFAFSCEGYKGVSQSAGHHIANNGIFQHVVGTQDEPPEGRFRINLLGEYNIGGDAFEIERILERCGITLVSTFSGNASYDQFARAHMADLNAVMCHRSINYMAEMTEEKYGIPWIKVNFIGAEATAKSLRKIAQYFGVPELIDGVERVIAEEMPAVRAVIDEIRPRTGGKTAMLFVGGSRAHHYQELFREIGMRTVAAGYEFGHRDDYEGRKVLPFIKVDADSRNIEELDVEPDPEQYRPRKTADELEALRAQGLDFGEYEGLMADMEVGSLVIDDITHHETERLIELYRPDVFCAGIKEKYVIQKHGIPMKQLHNYDYHGPYAGFRGAIRFYREIDRMVNTRIWRHVTPPWAEKPQPEVLRQAS